jgi:hypothetical protein
MTSTAAISDWATYLRGLTPCRFPRFSRAAAGKDAAAPGDPGKQQQQQISSVPVPVEHVHAEQLTALSTTDPEKFGAVLRTAWALLLRCYTGQDDVSFSFEQHGCHSDENESEPVGPVVARFFLDDDASVAGLVSRTTTELASLIQQAGAVPPELIQSDHAQQQPQQLFDTAIAVLWSGPGETSAMCRALDPV